MTKIEFNINNYVEFELKLLWDGEEFQTTNLLGDAIIHMWHQRDRHINRIVSPMHTMPNNQRYDLVLNDIKKILTDGA